MFRKSRITSLLLVLLVSGSMLLPTAAPAEAGPIPVVNAIDSVTVTDPACTGTGMIHVTGHSDGLPTNYVTAQAMGAAESRVDVPPFLPLWAVDVPYNAPAAPGVGFDVVVRLWWEEPVFGLLDVELDSRTVSIDCPVAPVATDDSATTSHNAPVVIDVAANDTDANGNLDPTSVTVTVPPASGAAVSNGDGTITYTPVLGGTGLFTFTYQICDLTALCDTADVTVEVTNEPPVANDDAASTSINTPVVIDVAANDSDADGDLVVSSVSVTVAPTSGTAVSNGDGTVTYSPNPGFHGTDTFTYQICDSGGLCDTAVVTVEVTTGGGGGGGGGGGDGSVPDNPSQAGDHADSHACEDNPGQANDHRPDNVPPCR
jgi:hypothetical protein